MNFINELITDEIRKSFDFTVYEDLMGRKKIFEDWELRKWAVNKSSSAYFFCIGSVGGLHVDAPLRTRYALFWRSQIVYFDSECKTEYELGGRPELTWFNSVVSVPPKLHAESRVVSVAVLNAVRDMGWGFCTKLNPIININQQFSVALIKD